MINGTSKSATIPPPALTNLLSTKVLDKTYVSLRSIYSDLIILLMARSEIEIQRFLIAYTVDLIRVLKRLFIIALVESTVTTTTITWGHLQRVFEEYEELDSRQRIQRIHKSICSDTTQTLTADDIRRKVRELLYNKQ